MRYRVKRFPTVVLVICSFLIILSSLKSACLRRAEASGREDGVVVSPLGYEGGGRFTAIAIDPGDPRVLFVGSDVAGVFKSADGGETFHLKGKGLEGFSVADIAIHPDDPGRVLLLTQDGLYASRDQGESWQKRAP